MDGEADRICDFVRILIAGVDNRLQTPAPIAAIGRVVPVAVETPAASPRASTRKETRTEAHITAQLAAPATAPRAAAAAAPGAGSSAPKTSKSAKSSAPTVQPMAVPTAAAAPVGPEPIEASKDDILEQPAPTPIAARTAARQSTSDVEPERELDRSGWVTPHSIEAQVPRKPTTKPRKWMP
jgi:hypothetical protein